MHVPSQIGLFKSPLEPTRLQNTDSVVGKLVVKCPNIVVTLQSQTQNWSLRQRLGSKFTTLAHVRRTTFHPHQAQLL